MRRPVLVAGLLLGAACGSTPPPDPNAGTVTLAVRADVLGFFPQGTGLNESYTFRINANVHEGLVRLDERFRLGPALASRWETPDDRTYLFDLRPGLRFGDGRPVTADDVVYSLESARSGSFGNQDVLQPVASVRALSPTRVEIKTTRAHPVFLQGLQFGFVVPRGSFAADAPASGAGPYRVASRIPGGEFVLEANPHYLPAPTWARARFRVVPDAAERVALVERGEADIADHVPLDAIDALRARGVSVVSRPGTLVLFLGFRQHDPPFDDIRVREAIALAIDRRELLARALHGHGEPADQPVPPFVVGYDPDLRADRVDRERARALLREAGHARGLRVRLDGPNNRYVNDHQILAEVARQLAEVGIEVEVNALPKDEFFRLILAGGSRFHLLGWACEAGEAGEMLDGVFHTAHEGRGADNVMDLSDRELDRLIEEADQSGDEAGRARILRAALRRVAALRPVVPLAIQPEAFALSSRVRWEPPPDFSLRLSAIRPAR